MSNSTLVSGEHDDIDTMMAETARIAMRMSFKFFIICVFCLICFCVEGLFRGIYKFHVLLILLTKVTYRSSLYRVQSYEYILKKTSFCRVLFF